MYFCYFYGVKSSLNIILITTILFLGFSSCDSIEEESQNVSDALAIQDSLNQAMDRLDRRMKEPDSAINKSVTEVKKALQELEGNGESVFKKFEIDSTMKDVTIRVEEYEE